jgi:hypothetical protein
MTPMSGRRRLVAGEPRTRESDLIVTCEGAAFS